MSKSSTTDEPTKLSAVAKALRLLVTSDIHLGHKQTPTHFIIKNLDTYLSNDKVLSQIDLVVLAGDVFEKILSLGDIATEEIDFWIARFLRICKKYNVMVRVLEGTKYHDRGQSSRFLVHNEILEKTSGFGVDIKHVKELSIEHIERFGIDVLYVPDEVNVDARITLAQVKGLMLDAGIKQVDYAFMHGLFDFQTTWEKIEEDKPNPTHNSREYLSLVKKLIFCGHDHVPNQFERIYIEGSFDRLKHQEEKPKGYLRATIEADGSYEVKFIENKGAKKYITVDCGDMDLQSSLFLIDNKVDKLPSESHVRVQCSEKSVMSFSSDTLKSRWPLLQWKVDAGDKKVAAKDKALLPDDPIYVSVALTPKNIKALANQRLDLIDMTDAVYAVCQTKLAELEKLT